MKTGVFVLFVGVGNHSCYVQDLCLGLNITWVKKMMFSRCSSWLEYTGE